MSFSFKNVNGHQAEDNYIILMIKDTINQSTFNVNVSFDISGFDLKNEIKNLNENLQAQNIRLVFSGRLLNDYFSLHHQGLTNHSIIYLIPQKIQKLENDQISDQQDQPLNSKDSSSTAAFLNIFQVSNTCVRTRKVKLFLNSLILKLDQAFSSNSLYIFNGAVLDKSKPFKYYNINNESTLVFIPADLSQSNPSLTEKWLKISNDSDSFQPLINSKANKACTKESSRLVDIKYNNIELKKKAFRSIFNEASLSNVFSNYQNDKTQLITKYDQIESPSVDPLPI